MLTHYTRTAEAVQNILTHGFAWIPNRRRLAQLLVPRHDYSAREPQQFGMISFTEITPEHSHQHCELFGHYGIVVTEDWATRYAAQRVIYVDKDGPVTRTLCAIFDIGYNDLTQRILYPEDAAWLMAYESKVMASSVAGATLWANLLQIWEYLEPAECAHQWEWRVVSDRPLYSLSENRTEAIRQVSPPENWAKHLNVIPIRRPDILSLVCRSVDKHNLMNCLPTEFNGIPIVEACA